MAYELPKASVTRLQKGDYNLSKAQGEILWKKKLYFKQETMLDLHQSIDSLSVTPAITKQHPRFIIVTDFETLLAVDTKTGDTLDILLTDLCKYYDFFLPWAGLEKTQFQSENPADVKAAERMGRLYDILLEDNPTEQKAELHALNIFLSRLLFCFFAEDTGIFQDNQFTNAIASHTATDGNDLQAYLLKLFAVLDLSDRADYPQFLQDFPYVNGGLFADEHPIPTFSAQSRKIIIECGGLNWKAINPDIFGSMIQAVVHNDQRSSLGMHYTSVTNIMKVIEPLFLNELYAALEKAGEDEKKLTKLLGRLYNLRIFDPACGSGNFLIIAYKELCKLEMEIFRQLQKINAANWGHAVSGLHLNQFYGIELDDFAYETAKLSLWLTAHQMNIAFKAVFGETRPTLPLQDAGHIVCGNATRLDWELVCPKMDLKGNVYEIYILGNPPYLGFRNWDNNQKEDMRHIFGLLGNVQRLDYIGCWFIKGSNYIANTNSKFSYVSTNSICQGEQVSLLWPIIFDKNQEIYFAHSSFKWSNNAKHNAGVTCIIIGIQNNSNNPKKIFTEKNLINVKNINPYLIDAENIFIEQRTKSLSGFPEMALGSSSIDGGFLILSPIEKNRMISEDNRAGKFIKPYIGGNDFLKGLERYCLWIDDNQIQEANQIELIKQRIEKCKNYRLGAGRDAQKAALVPHRFFYRKYKEGNSFIVPFTSSENRTYLPVGYEKSGTVISNGLFVIYDSTPLIFGILSSKMHMIWTKIVSGKLETRIRYSVNIAYNNFPFPEILENAKQEIEKHVYNVLDEREQHSEKTIAQLYDPDKMPAGLRKAHHEMDLAIEQCYRPQPFKSDEERLEYLFKLYEAMITTEDKI